MDKAFEFKLKKKGRRPALILKDLLAEVDVAVGKSFKVVLDGDDDLVKNIEVANTNENEITVSGNLEQSRGGAVHISNSIVTNVSGGSISIVNGVVTINGKIITAAGEKKEFVKIKIEIPEKTDLWAYGVLNANVIGPCSNIYARVSGQGKFYASDVLNCDISCSGQSNCKIKKAKGKCLLRASGQSDISVQGEFGQIEASVSGQSSVNIIGKCEELSAEASGQSDIKIIGEVKNIIRQYTSGQAYIDII
jgi:hypothetical protein